MRKRISTIIFVIIFLIGLSILLYPAVSEYVNERHSSRAIASYDKLVEELPEADYSKELQDAQDSEVQKQDIPLSGKLSVWPIYPLPI